ncbi:MAG: S-layer homology domain-containing protein [Acutalibacter sp.]
MLVVAMIPLSAAASEPALQQVRAEADGETVLLTQNGDTFTGTYRAGAQTIELQLVVGTENLVYYTDTTTTTPTDRYVDDGPVVNFQVNRDQYADAEGNVTIEFSVADASDAKVRDYYTVELTPVEASTETKILDFSINRVVGGTVMDGGNSVPNIETAEIGVDFIRVTVPYDAPADGYVIRNMVLSNGAKATVKDTDGATVANGTNVPGVQNGAPSVPVDDEYTITVSNGNHNQTYTLHIEVAPGFTSFTTEEGLDAVLFPDSGKIAVLLPYGYSTGKTSISLTPVFELDYPSAEASWTSGETETIDVSAATDVNKTVFTSFKGTDTTPHLDWDGAKTLVGNDGVLSFSEFTKNAAVAPATSVKIQYTDDTTREYDVYLFETEKNNATAITGLTIGSEQAVIDEENKTIDIVLPAGTNLEQLNMSNDPKTKFTMTASNGAKITFPALVNDSLNETTPSNTGDNRTATDTYTDNWKVDAREPISVLVKSEDNDCSGNEQYYTLNITASDNYEDAKITGMSIQSPDGKYTYDATPDANGKIVLQVPYYVYDKAELKDWKLFYTKTVGTSVTYKKGAVDTALPVSGAALKGDEAWIGYPGSNEAGADITANMIGEDLSQNTRVYNVQIDRVAAKTDSTLKNFSIIGDTENNKADNTHAAQIDQSKKTIAAGVAWAAYKQWNWTEFNAVAEAAADANAKIYFKNLNGDLVPLINEGADDETPVIKFATAYDSSEVSKNAPLLYDGAQIYVLSEQMWVNLEANGAMQKQYDVANTIPVGKWTAQVNDSNRSFYTVYSLDISYNDPREGAELTDVTLVDGTGWTADLEVDISNSLLKGTIPYALTSDLKVEKDDDGEITKVTIDSYDSLNPIFLAYDVDDGAWVMGYEEKYLGNKTTPRLDGKDSNDDKYKGDSSVATEIPEAGSGWSDNAVFEDIKDYKASEYANYLVDKDGNSNPFLLISREGDVFICYNKGRVVSLKNFTVNPDVNYNQLVATNEDGEKEFDVYTFDLKVAEPNSETEFTSFNFKGYERFPGVIDAVNDTITVTLPYGTEYTYLVPNYTVSSGAIVTVDDPELMGKPLYNGETDVNFTTTRKFTVIAENEKNSTEWTVRVVVSSAFTDVNPGDWFYDNVMDAAQNGYVSGMGDGTFQPKKATTRAEFASMIAKAMGYTDSDATGETRFTDVDADQWYAGAITYCYDNGIILG